MSYEVTALQMAAQKYTDRGWTVKAMTDKSLVLERLSPMPAIFVVVGILGLLLYVIPGLIVLVLGAMSRKRETLIVTAAEAVEMFPEGQGEEMPHKRRQDGSRWEQG